MAALDISFKPVPEPESDRTLTLRTLFGAPGMVALLNAYQRAADGDEFTIMAVRCIDGPDIPPEAMRGHVLLFRIEPIAVALTRREAAWLADRLLDAPFGEETREIFADFGRTMHAVLAHSAHIDRPN